MHVLVDLAVCYAVGTVIILGICAIRDAFAKVEPPNPHAGHCSIPGCQGRHRSHA